MATDYGWRGTRSATRFSRPSRQDYAGWWAGVALLVAIVLHVGAFLALGKIQIALGLKAAPEELQTARARVERVDFLPENYRPEVVERSAPEPEKITDTRKLLDEIEVIAKLPEQEIDIKPQVERPEFALALSKPKAAGQPEAMRIDAPSAIDFDITLPDTSSRGSQVPLTIAKTGQVAIDPGDTLEDDGRLGKFTDEIIRKGAGGKAPKGALDGVTSLDDMMGLPADVLVGKKTMLPGDLLFEYNSATLRESARVGLMKLALLVSTNPDLYCWLEGHSDLYGGDEFNRELSLRRAEAVRSYLVGTLRLPAEKISARGLGKSQPLVRQGTAEEQALNRRVEIRMRRSPAPAAPKPVATAPPVPEPAVPAEKPGPQKPVVVKPEPQKAIPVEEVPPPPRRPQTRGEQPVKPEGQPGKPQKAIPVPAKGVPRAVDLPDEPPRAIDVPEDAPVKLPEEKPVPRAVDLDNGEEVTPALPVGPPPKAIEIEE